jgi:proline iminopeptidase
MTSVSVKGAELHFSARGTGPTCLVLTGIGTRPYERQTPPELSDRLRLVYVDLRGSGRSTGEPADLTFDLLADDLEAVRNDLGLEQVCVLGHSILGALALEYGRRCPESVSHVIAVGTPPIGDMTQVATAANAFFEEDASQGRKQALRESLAGLPAGPSLRQALLAQSPRRFFDPRFDAAPFLPEASSNPRLLMHLLMTLLPRWDVRVGSSTLRVPTFIALGRYDYVMPHSLWEGVAPSLPNATLRVFLESGHQPFFEEPERFADEVKGWMSREP